MKPREAIQGVIRHEEVRPVPCAIDWGADVGEGDVGERLGRHYGDTNWRARVPRYFLWTSAVDTMRRGPFEDKDGWAKDLYGSVWRNDHRPFHLETPGLPEPTFDGYEWPRPDRFFNSAQDIAQTRRICSEHKDELYVLADLGWGLLEHAWSIRGFENVLMDSAAEPDFFEELLDRLTEQLLSYVDYTCASLPDIDAVFFGDDWGDQRGVIVGPERWRRYFKPRWAKIYDRVHSYGKMTISHCCGSVADIMDDVVEIGLDVFESMQPEARGMNPYGLKKRWGDRITYWGCLGSQSLLAFGTPNEVAAEVRRLCREMGKGGGYIFAPSKSFQPETPTENAAAVIDAMLDQESSY